MFFEDIDFYDVLKDPKRVGLDPCLTREENKKKLQSAAKKWNKLFGAEADVTKQLITEALNIFKSQKNYKKYRMWYTEFKLGPFIEGASIDGKLIKDKAEEVKERARNYCIGETEVEELFQRMNLEIVDKLPTGEQLIDFRSVLPRLKYVFAVLLVIILGYTVYNYLPLNLINPKANVVQSNPDKEINEALYVVNKSAPLWLEFRQAVRVLLQYKDNPSYTTKIDSGLQRAKQYAIKMGKEGPNDKEALDWLEIARNIDPNDSEVNRLIEAKSIARK